MKLALTAAILLILALGETPAATASGIKAPAGCVEVSPLQKFDPWHGGASSFRVSAGKNAIVDQWFYMAGGATVKQLAYVIAAGESVTFYLGAIPEIPDGYQGWAVACSEMVLSVAGPWLPTYSISGRVSDVRDNPISGVQIEADPGEGKQVYTAHTGSNGDYTLSNVLGAIYVLTPSLAGSSFSPVTRTIAVPPNAAAQHFRLLPAWTLMFYQAGDNDSSQEARLDYEYTRLRPASANANTEVTAFWDGLTSQAHYARFSPSQVTTVPKGETNTGSPDTLRNFVLWAQQAYPAQHYALIISDHGSGVSGAALDVNVPAEGKDRLTPGELRQALTGTPKIDVIYMNACLMATIETAYQLRGLADFYVASESKTWGSIQPEWFITGHASAARTIPAITASTTAEELATGMAWAWVLLGRDAYQLPSTISVMRLSNVEEAAARASALAGQIRSHMSEMKPVLDSIRHAGVLQHYEMDGDGKITDLDKYVDLQHFASLVASRNTDPAIQLAADELITATQNLVVQPPAAWSGSFRDDKRNLYTWDHQNSNGVSIFFPSPDQRDVFYNGDWLDFAAGTNWQTRRAQVTQEPGFEWGQMLVEYVAAANPGAPDNPAPPPLLPPGNVPQWLYLPLLVR